MRLARGVAIVEVGHRKNSRPTSRDAPERDKECGVTDGCNNLLVDDQYRNAKPARGRRR
jgi:hypothetical protein